MLTAFENSNHFLVFKLKNKIYWQFDKKTNWQLGNKLSDNWETQCLFWNGHTRRLWTICSTACDEKHQVEILIWHLQVTSPNRAEPANMFLRNNKSKIFFGRMIDKSTSIRRRANATNVSPTLYEVWHCLSAKSNGSVCLLSKYVDTAFRFCTAHSFPHIWPTIFCWAVN